MNTLFTIWNTIQTSLFPLLEEEIDPLSKKEQKFVQILSLMDLVKHISQYNSKNVGRKRKSRLNIAKAFIAKAVYNFETTDILIEYLKSAKNLRRLCGWETSYDVPSKSTFSRAFEEFSKGEFPQKIHEAMISRHYDTKLAGHISRDSTAIESREKAVKTQKTETPSVPKRGPGRPKKGEVVPPKPPKRLDLQPNRSLEDNLNDLPTHCDIGVKKDSKGYKNYWKGYKLHLDCVDGDIPISAVLTSASLHDSQAAIPLAQMSSERIDNLYDLMDAAYDAPQIHSFSSGLGHKPIIDHNPRRGKKKHMDSITKRRFAERNGVERINSYLKDNHGGRSVRVKGATKVMTHLMFGLIVITANQLFGLL